MIRLISIYITVAGAAAFLGWMVAEGLQTNGVASASSKVDLPSRPKQPPKHLLFEGPMPGETYRRWFALLQNWSHAGPPTTEQAADLREHSTQVLGLADSMSNRTQRISDAAIAEAGRGLGATQDEDEITALALQAPRKAIAFIQKLQLGRREAAKMERKVLQVWAVTDGRAAIEQARSLKWAGKRIASLLHQWAAVDPRSALNYMLSNAKRFSEAESKPELVFISYYDRDSASARDWLRKLPNDRLRWQIQLGFITHLAHHDPATGISMIEEFDSESQEARTAWSTFANQYSRSNPEAALQWAQTLIDPEQRDDFTADAIAAFAKQSPSKAAEVFARISVPKYQGSDKPIGAYKEALAKVFDHLRSEDPKAAEAWLVALPADVRAVAMPGVYDAIRKSSTPEEAWKYLSARPENAAKTEVVPKFIVEQTSADAGGALRMASSLPAGKTRDYCEHNAVLELAKYDAAAAENFVLKMDPSRIRSRTAPAVARRLAESDPEAAFAVVDLVEWESSRQRTENQIFDAVAESAPTRALSLIEMRIGQLTRRSESTHWLEEARSRVEESMALRAYLRGE